MLDGLSKKDARRVVVLIKALSDMSRNGWRDARPDDYVPLERELRELRAKQAG